MQQTKSSRFDKDILKFDVDFEISKIVEKIKSTVFKRLRKRGGVIGVSGGIDSAVVLALTMQALGKEKTLPLLLPEKESSPDSARLAIDLCERLECEYIVEDMTNALTGFDAYRRRDKVVSQIFPNYNSSCRLKISIPEDLLTTDTLSFYELSIITAEGKQYRERLDAYQLRQIVAATNFKQRSRAAMLYYYAELHNYAVIGTSQRNEHDLGFFVKYGDSAADVRPLGHLFKTQVYYLAERLKIPKGIIDRPPTSDTYSAISDQVEFFFRIPFEQLDLIWYALEHDIPPELVSRKMGLSVEQVKIVFADIQQKQRTTQYLREKPIDFVEQAIY